MTIAATADNSAVLFTLIGTLSGVLITAVSGVVTVLINARSQALEKNNDRTHSERLARRTEKQKAYIEYLYDIEQLLWAAQQANLLYREEDPPTIPLAGAVPPTVTALIVKVEASKTTCWLLSRSPATRSAIEAYDRQALAKAAGRLAALGVSPPDDPEKSSIEPASEKSGTSSSQAATPIDLSVAKDRLRAAFAAELDRDADFSQ